MIAAFIPPSAYCISIFPCHSIGDWEPKWFCDFLSLSFSVDGTSNNIGAFFSERSTAFLVACKQATAIGSPMTSIK